MFWSTRKTVELDYGFENVSIHPTAEVSQDVEIGPFSYIGPHCQVDEGCRLHNNVSLVSHTVLGKNSEVFPGAVIGAVPQDKKYRGEDSWVLIGHANSIRECVTIHGGTAASGGVTRVGDRNLLMAGCHVAHDCVLEDDIVVANNVLLGGHVKIERHANLGGLAAVHHFVTVGQHAFVGGAARVSRDVPPYLLFEGTRPRTINKVGLRRRGFSEATIRVLERAYKLLYRSHLLRREAVRQLREEPGEHEEIRVLVEFLEATLKGHLGRAMQPYDVSF